ncbi:MFS transporter TsgA [Buchnera aphidicola]|uniref:MFS transporter TsgA n=1 Tax=Buchnera aphidicola (Sarucallis kahawaluokalani) TaxID=1241878 RepID=A0A4D6YDJ4_9GAMM|nr:MFS transporter TsgA [Buchnera aphidicola]QCI26143.1 MFS transporter TsgA [Buchnera aphidicola (Sarucallis kahawaluokalani)]
MKKKDKLGLTIISFLSYYLTGAMIVITGVIIRNIAQYFKLSISDISNTFTFLNAGILISIFLNSWITKIISLKKQIIIGFILIITAIIGFINLHSVLFLCVNMFILGMVGGITMSIGTFLITNIYHGEERTSKLLITDSFFSMAGIIFPIITAFLLNNHVLWYWIYFIIGTIYFIIFLITINVQFPIYQIESEVPNIKNKTYQLSVLILCFTALCYILGQLGFISWIPEYARQTIGMNIKSASHLVSNFWCSYMIGMWCFSYILKFIDLQIALTTLSGISTFLMYLFIHNHSIKLFNFIILALGFFSSAIYTIIITLASLQTKQPSQKIINLILVCGTVGTLLTFIITGPIVSTMGIKDALMIPNILYSIVFILCGILYFTSKHKKHF